MPSTGRPYNKDLKTIAKSRLYKGNGDEGLALMLSRQMEANRIARQNAPSVAASLVKTPRHRMK